MSKRRKQTEFQVALYGREALPSLQEIEAVFSWRVVRTESVDGAIRCAIAEAGMPPRIWKWALLRWPASRVTGARPRIDALRLIHSGKEGSTDGAQEDDRPPDQMP